MIKAGKNRLNFAIIGSFWLTEKMISVIEDHDRANYCAQYSRSISRAKEFVGKRAVKLYDSIDEMANDDEIDAVYIASPNYLHYEHSKKLITAKKHVLCEKPIAVHEHCYKELCDLADRNDVVYAEAMMNAHLPAMGEIKKLIGSDVLGGNINFCQRSSKLDNYNKGIIASTFDKKCCGGALMDLGVYVVSFIVQLFGEPRNIVGRAVYGTGDADLTDALIFHYDNFSITATISKAAASKCPSEIITPNLSITVGNVSRLQDICVIENDQSKRIETNSSFEYCLKRELDDFIMYIDGNTEAYDQSRMITASTVSVLAKAREAIGYYL